MSIHGLHQISSLHLAFLRQFQYICLIYYSITMYFESFDRYIDALRKWDGSTPKPRSIYERALIQSRDFLLDGDTNYVLVPGMDMLLKVLKNGERFSVVERTSVDLEPLLILYKECLPGVAQPWIDLCFFEDDNGIHYDTFYDSFPMGCGIDTTIKQYLDKLEQCTDDLLHIPADSVLTVADAEAFQKPLRYLLEQKSIKVFFFDSSSSVSEAAIEPSALNLELTTPFGPFVPCAGKTYRVTSYEGQSLPSYAASPEPLYNFTDNGKSVQVFSYLVRFESDCFGNVIAFSSVSSDSPDSVKITPLF